MAKIEINDTNFYYELHGYGQPIILISGYTCDHQIWLPILDALSKKFQVLIFDNRGSGQTRDNGIPLTAKLMAQDAIALADALNLYKPHIVGHSMGGTIAQEIASSFPERINKLAILASTIKWREAMLIGLKTHLDMREQNINFDILFEAILSWVFGQKFLKNKNNIALFKQMWLEDKHPQSLSDQKRQFQVLQEFDGENKLKNIIAPTLIVNAVQDLISLSFESEVLAKQIANAQLVHLNAAHGLMLEEPQRVADILLQFFQD